MVKIPLQLRKDIATLLLVLLAFNCGVRIFKRTLFLDSNTIPMDIPTFQENRLKGLKELLPKRGVVGFVNDESEGNQEKIREFFLTQYVLTPLIVAKSKDQKLVVANFKTDADFKKWLGEKPFMVLKDLKNGVALLQQKVK